MKPLDEAKVAIALAELPEWRRVEGEIVREYAFEAYAHGSLFAAGVALMADRANHHPDLLLTYRKVEVRLSTHDAGGLTSLDFDLAREIENLFRSR